MQGKTLAQAKQVLTKSGLSFEQVERLAPHKVMKGNTPSNTLLLKALTPKSLGALFALYEHKIFVQGLLWQVNSFDQWGVELGKELGKEILTVMEGGNSENLSSSTLALIDRFLTPS
jgi:glucose-6-phosphate isomerase